MNEKRKERQQLSQLGIEFVTAILPDQFPTHLRTTFQRIRSFRQYDFSTFCLSGPLLTTEKALWRSELANRAKEIVAIAVTLIEDATVEMEVRLRLEQKVLMRFDRIIECPICGKRLWRSEVEVEIEFPARIAKSLATRQQERRPCQCPPEERESQLSKIFSSRADEMTSFDSFKTFPEESIKSRRPDRILGFQETNSFSRRLENHNLMAGRLEKEPELETIWETIDSTILNHKGKALLFPFLIIEAKSRTGASFEDCNLQTALPILKMLKIQEDLQKKSQMTLEYGGPLVWYIAYRGEDWRLSGCYISEKLGGTSYEIITLWTGQLNDVESALQLLLILDYIFDWARDIYKPSLISQLEMLASKPCENDSHIRDDSFTRVDTDSDVLSLARPKQRKTIEDWGATLELDTEVVPDEERSLMKWAAHDTESKSDFSTGVFRPACIAQNLFRCLLVTNANIEVLFSAVPPRCTAKQLAKQATSALDNYQTVLVSEDVLDLMEEVWTGRVRPKKAGHIPEKRLFASIAYHTDVTSSWELQRIIYCLAFDEGAFSKFKGYTPRKSPPVPFKHAKRFGRTNAEALIRTLRNHSIQQNLASTLASQTQELHQIGAAFSTSSCPTFEFRDVTYVHNGWNQKNPYEVVDRVYDWCEKNSEEPTEPFFRVSRQWNSLTSSLTPSTVASYFPNSVPAADEQYILVERDYPLLGYEFCIYVISGLTDVTNERLRKILRNASKADVFYKYSTEDEISNNWKNVYKKWLTTDSRSCQEALKQVNKWRYRMRAKTPVSLPVPLPTAEKTKSGPVEHLPQARPSSKVSSRVPSSSLSAPVIAKARSNVKRPGESADGKDVHTVSKKVKK